MIVFDELHKEKGDPNMVKRAGHMHAVMTRRKNVYRLGITGTPVINDVDEGWRQIELLKPKELLSLKLQSSAKQEHSKLMSYIALHRAFCLVPSFRLHTSLSDNNKVTIKRLLLPEANDLLKDEKELTRRRAMEFANIIRDVVINKKQSVFIYTHRVGDKGGENQIVDLIKKEIEKRLREQNQQVPTMVEYTGNISKQKKRKTLELFGNGEAKVLIGSKAIGTGVDGLQRCCSTLIFNTLPDTYAEYQQVSRN